MQDLKKHKENKKEIKLNGFCKLKKYFLISCLMICLFFGVKAMITYAGNRNQNISNELIIFSEHHTAFYSGHNIKFLDIHSGQITDLGIKTCSHGDFFIIKSNRIAWFCNNELFIWNPKTAVIEKKKIQIFPFPMETLISVSPSGDKIAYLKSYGRRLYIGGRPKSGQYLKSLGFISELHIFDLVKNEDYIITTKVSDWGAPQWSPDEKKILFTRPADDNYFVQSFLDKVKIGKDDFWQKSVQSAIFIYDLDKNIEYKLCLGIVPQWNSKGDKIVFLTENNRIGIFSLADRQKIELPTRGNPDLISFKAVWSSNETYIAYLGKPKLSLIYYARGLIKGYERPSGLWIISIDGIHEEYLKTRNFGNIKCAPYGYKIFIKSGWK